MGVLLKTSVAVWIVVMLVVVSGERTIVTFGSQSASTSQATITSSPTAKSSPRTLHSNSTPVTLSPGIKINYTLELFNNGPVVLDAQIKFIARLRNQNGKIAQSKEFLYDWNNNADKKFLSAPGQLEFKYVHQFHSLTTKSGTWVMTVAVYTGNTHGQIINFGSMKFDLTDSLNGYIRIQQPLEYQRDQNIFSTDKKVQLFANHTDIFPHSPLLHPTYHFFWYKDNEFVQSSEIPYLNLTIDKEGNFTMQTEVYAFFPDVQNLGNNSNLVSASCQATMMHSFNSPLRRRKMHNSIADKCGIFTLHLTVKKPLESVDILGQRSAALGEYVVINVTCKGSYPTSVCWNMTAMNTSEPSLNATCPPNEFRNTCTHKFRIKLTTLGWKTVWFTVYNDVSYMSTPFNVYAYDQNSVNVPALTIPIVFCTLGLLVIIIGAAYLNKLRKKPVIEVADFDFHPSVSTSGTRNIFSRLANKIRLVMLTNTYNKNQRIPEFRETTAKQYGATSLNASL